MFGLGVLNLVDKRNPLPAENADLTNSKPLQADFDSSGLEIEKMPTEEKTGLPWALWARASSLFARRSHATSDGRGDYLIVGHNAAGAMIVSVDECDQSQIASHVKVS